DVVFDLNAWRPVPCDELLTAAHVISPVEKNAKPLPEFPPLRDSPRLFLNHPSVCPRSMSTLERPSGTSSLMRSTKLIMTSFLLRSMNIGIGLDGSFLV